MRACCRQSVESPPEPWFWPPVPVPAAEEEADGQQDGESPAAEEEEEEVSPFSPSEQLEMLTDYLRRSHLYCVWCGCAYNDEDDLRENCPGATREDH